MESLSEFERLLGLDVFPHIVQVHHVQQQLIGKYMREWHTLAENAPTWPAPYTPFENTTSSLAPKDYSITLTRAKKCIELKFVPISAISTYVSTVPTERTS